MRSRLRWISGAAVLVLACSSEDAEDSGNSGLEADGSDAPSADAPPPDASDDASDSSLPADAGEDASIPDGSAGAPPVDASDGSVPDASPPVDAGSDVEDASTDAAVPKPTCGGVWQTSLVASNGLSKIAITPSNEPIVMTGGSVWSKSGASWTSSPLPIAAGDIVIVPQTGEMQLCGTQCAGPAPTPPTGWFGNPPNPFCSGAHAAGGPAGWTVTKLPALPDDGYFSCGIAPYYAVRWLGSPCAIDALADGSVEIVQKTQNNAPLLEVCGDTYYHASKQGSWSLQSFGFSYWYAAYNERLAVRLDSTGAAHWNSLTFGAAKYQTTQTSWLPWVKDLPPYAANPFHVGLGSVRLALDPQGKPTFAGASWSKLSAGATDAVYFVTPDTTSGGNWTYDEIASTPPTATSEIASDTKPGLAYMQNGQPVVCWAANGLRCAIRAPNGSWTEQLVATDADPTDEVEIQVAPNGCCHIGYHSVNGAVRHATDC